MGGKLIFFPLPQISSLQAVITFLPMVSSTPSQSPIPLSLGWFVPLVLASSRRVLVLVLGGSECHPHSLSGWWILSSWADLQLSGWCWNWMVFFAGDTQTLHTKGCSLQCSPVMLWHAVYPPLTSIIIVSWDVVVDLTQVHVTGYRYFLVTIFGLCGTAKLTANLNSQYISLKLLWSSSVSCDFLLFTFQPDSGALFLTLSEWIPVALCLKP